jgi:hypothetical protein
MVAMVSMLIMMMVMVIMVIMVMRIMVGCSVMYHGSAMMLRDNYRRWNNHFRLFVVTMVVIMMMVVMVIVMMIVMVRHVAVAVVAFAVRSSGVTPQLRNARHCIRPKSGKSEKHFAN